MLQSKTEELSDFNQPKMMAERSRVSAEDVALEAIAEYEKSKDTGCIKDKVCTIATT